VSDELEDAQDPHDSHESDDFPSLSNDLNVLKTVQEDREEEGDDGEQVHHIHGLKNIDHYEKTSSSHLSDESDLLGRAGESDEVLQEEVCDAHVVHHLQRKDGRRVARDAIVPVPVLGLLGGERHIFALAERKEGFIRLSVGDSSIMQQKRPKREREAYSTLLSSTWPLERSSGRPSHLCLR